MQRSLATALWAVSWCTEKCVSRSTRNRQIRKQRFYSRNAERFTETSCAEANRVHSNPGGPRHYSFERPLVFGYDERFEPNRDAGFATERGSLIKFANSGRADCESVSIASRTGLDEMG